MNCKNSDLTPMGKQLKKENCSYRAAVSSLMDLIKEALFLSGNTRFIHLWLY
jgi:hypothetical protein